LREQFLPMLHGEQIGAEGFERAVESFTTAGDIGAVMRSEVFTPAAESELGRTCGARAETALNENPCS
jgi:hypothetical protein